MQKSADVAALYIDPKGPYPRIEGVDCWDAARHAEEYRGPWPVVAHPPCGPWSKLRHLAKHDDPALAVVAAWQVRAFGGVLEQPAHSKLFDFVPIAKPWTSDPWGFTIEVNQVSWGHACVKPTWLYFVRVPIDAITLRTGGTPTRCVCTGPGFRHMKVASKEVKRRTPTLFAEWLVSLARKVVRRCVI